ncbi:MAG: M56 family metallopeptidase [Bulleidia sp.]
MMETLFRTILRMSLEASAAILIVLLFRCALVHAKRFWSCLLWLPVLFRMVCPVAISWSLFSQLHSETASAVSEKISSAGFLRAAQVSESSAIQTVSIFTLIWLCGIAVLSVRSYRSYQGFRKSLPEASGSAIVESRTIQEPFICGILHPVIYLPEDLKTEERAAVICHESAHIRYKDPLMKFVFWIAVIIHWFNPLCWLAFCLMSQDFEIRADEQVLEEGTILPDSYAEVMLRFARRSYGLKDLRALGFSAGPVKYRIRHALKHDSGKLKPIPAAILCFLCMTGCLMNPQSNANADLIPITSPKVQDMIRRSSFEKEDQLVLEELLVLQRKILIENENFDAWIAEDGTMTVTAEKTELSEQDRMLEQNLNQVQTEYNRILARAKASD